MADYSDRQGYDPAFLRPGKLDGRVFLPQLGKELAPHAVLQADRKSYVLPYFGYSVVMHDARHLAIYSAANVDFSGRFDLARPKDVWLTDPRIPADRQVTGEFYVDNQFDRGHLTRREDMEYGKTRTQALRNAADTCHWTNCTPQHARFNEGRQLWQGIERHVLEEAAIVNSFRAQVITGPILDRKDPVLQGFPRTPYPLRYWKIAAAINARNELFAAAFILDQSDVIKQFGVRGAPDVPFPPFKNYQVTIATVEKLTGLTFTGSAGRTRVSLSEFDPLSRRARARGGAPLPSVRQLTSLSDIVVSA